MLTSKRKGQSILEYAMVLGLVVTGILIMQTFVKRGFQGGLKDSADKMGSQFSSSNTTTQEYTEMGTDQTIIQETATNATIQNYLLGDDALDSTSGTVGTVSKGVYSYTGRRGGDSTMVSKMKTDKATTERFKWSDHANTVAPDYTTPALADTFYTGGTT